MRVWGTIWGGVPSGVVNLQEAAGILTSWYYTLGQQGGAERTAFSRDQAAETPRLPPQLLRFSLGSFIPWEASCQAMSSSVEEPTQ